ncbi:Retrovirus-related Pol polyprotein from transposon TNT 1-94, partial [Durusdinium trenchii]
MHVDDLQFVGPAKEGAQIAEALQKAFTMDVQGPFHEPGDTCQFLKKYFHFNEAGIAIRPNEKHFLALEKLLKLSSFGKKLKGPVHPDLCKEDHADLLSAAKAEMYRKAVGIILYISSDRPEPDVQIQLRSDSVAGRGIAKRQGLGRVRHLEVQFLWVQQKLAEKQFRLGPVASMVISGDLGTKSLQVNRLSFLLGLLGMVDCHEEFSLVGRDEMQRQQHDQEFREKFKNALKVFRYSFENGSDASSRDNALVKLILQICMVSSLARGADGREDQSIEQFAFDSTDFLFLAFVMLVICA